MESLRISPNTVLTRNGLEVNGEPRLLGHRDAFMTVARVTGAMVASILERVFPVPTAAPLPSGEAVTASVPAWEDYSRQLQALAQLPSDSDDALARSQLLVQWCIAAHVAAVVGNLEVARDPEFLAVAYLALHGPAALAHSPQSWQAYSDWLTWSKSPAGLRAQLTGEGERTRPQAAALRMTTPWPELLGADLGGAARLPEHISRHATDIIVTRDSTSCRMLSHSLRLTSDFGLVERFKSALVSDTGTELCGFDWEVAGIRYFVRARRTQAHTDAYYVFRVLPTGIPVLPSLDALMTQ